MKLVQKAREPDRREILKSAIEAAERLNAKVAEAQVAVRRGEEMVAEAQAQYDAATVDAENAVELHVQRLAEAATSGMAAAANAGRRDSRVRQMDCEDDLASAKRALISLRSVLAEAEEAAGLQTSEIIAATKAVMSAEADRILDEANDLHDQLCQARHTLHFLQKFALSDDQTVLWRRINDLLGRTFDESNWRASPVVKKWQDVHEALTTNAETPLP